jgi:hypothetical protein
MGRWEDALVYADRLVSLAANEPFPYRYKAFLHLLLGDTAASRQSLQLGVERVGMTNMLYIMARDPGYRSLFRVFDEYGETVAGLSQESFRSDTSAYLTAKVYSYYANADQARLYYDSLANWLTASLQLNPEGTDVRRAWLVQAYAGSGQNEVALQEAAAVSEWVEGLPLGSREMSASLLADAYLMLGEEDAAVEHLRIALDQRVLTPAILRLDPFWDPLRDHPGFQELLEGGI